MANVFFFDVGLFFFPVLVHNVLPRLQGQDGANEKGQRQGMDDTKKAKIDKSKNSETTIFQHFLKYRRNSNKISSKSQQKSMERFKRTEFLFKKFQKMRQK